MKKALHHIVQKLKYRTARKHRQSWLRWLIGELHLWLGLASGIIVVIVCLSGCLFCFQQEISNSTFRNTFFVAPQQKPAVSVAAMRATAQAVLGPSKPIESITAYREPDRAWEFMAYKSNDSAKTYFGELVYFESVFIDPYTGKVTGTRNYKYDFFSIVKYLHWSLLLSTRIGQPIVGWSTLVFVVLLLTGLVLWWPKKWNKATRQQSFNIKWTAKFKRLNYDLHNVLGFYTLLVALVIGLTGMVFAFQWFYNLVYVAATGSATQPEYVQKKSIVLPDATAETGLDKVLANAFTLLPDAKRIGLGPAESKDGAVYVYGYKGRETYYDRDDLQFDQYSGKLLYRRNRAERNRGEKLLDMNYDIHVGAVGGLTGKIIAFVVCLICGSLPVTGFLVWWHKRKKTKKPARADRKAPGIVAAV